MASETIQACEQRKRPKLRMSVAHKTCTAQFLLMQNIGKHRCSGNKQPNGPVPAPPSVHTKNGHVQFVPCSLWTTERRSQITDRTQPTETVICGFRREGGLSQVLDAEGAAASYSSTPPKSSFCRAGFFKSQAQSTRQLSLESFSFKFQSQAP